ncbi:MAG: uncharacterized protein K0S07_1410 [Chlamydiales bacterium]|jgi:flagellin-like hook-associated protein FlgL|nr:uncharacterized protein [Chlamydiales bacterium]
MQIVSNGLSKIFALNYSRHNSKLQKTMQFISNGRREMSGADIGISERFKNQIRKGSEASRVMQNGINFLQTADRYLGEVNEILQRMGELATAASDGSKNQADRDHLNVEFQQLKQEIHRIAEHGKYNGQKLMSQTAIAYYDGAKQTINFCDEDGSFIKALPVNFTRPDSHGVPHALSRSFSLTPDGQDLIYYAWQNNVSPPITSQNTLLKLEIASDRITVGPNLSFSGDSLNASNHAHFIVDDKNRLWGSIVSSGGIFGSLRKLQLIDPDHMTLDGGGASAANQWSGNGSVRLTSGFARFTVNDDYAYFFTRSNNLASNPLAYVKQSIYNPQDLTVLLSDLSGSSYSLQKFDAYAVSPDGQYIAYEESNGKLSVINAHSGQKASRIVGSHANSIGAIGFDANNNLYWSDSNYTGSPNALKKATIDMGATPTLLNEQIVVERLAQGSAFFGQGFNLNPSSPNPAALRSSQVGTEAGMTLNFKAADVRLGILNIGALSLANQEDAGKALSGIARAIDTVASQRAGLGAQVKRFSAAQSVNDRQVSNFAQADSLISDIDTAKEVCEMTKEQIVIQANLNVMDSIAQARQTALQLVG